jgi:RimJ/RimL family protein N-acetyltransferase
MLKGKRVLLRSVRRDDLERLCEFNNDIEVELAGGGDPPFPQSLERLHADYDKDISRGGRDPLWFAIETDGLFIGQCALFNFNDMNQTCEVGIAIGDKAYWGKGYGRETIMLLLDYSFRLRNIRKVFLTTNSTNERALRAYRACGFVEEGRLRQHVWNNGAYVDFVYMGILRDEWQPIET